MELMTKTAKVTIHARTGRRAVDLREVASALIQRAGDIRAADFLEGIGARRPRNAGGRLRAWRKIQGLTLRELAKRSGVAYQNLSAIENGRRPLGLDVAHKLSASLRVDYRLLV